MKQIRNMRELELMKQNLSFKIMLLEDKMIDRSGDMVDTLTNRLRDVAFEMGMKLISNLFFRKDKDKETTG